MYFDDAVHIEKTDQCYTCEFFAKGVQCPLLEALAVGVVELTGEMTVQNCGFYSKFERKLRVVEEAYYEEEQENEDRDEDSGTQSRIRN